MLGQTDREKIPAALPRGTQIANKTGELTGTRNDVAIVNPFGDAPLVLAILTKDATDYGAANAAIHAVARAVYASLRGLAGFDGQRSHGVAAPNRVERFETLRHRAEDRVLTVEKTRVGETEVKLRSGAVRARTSAPSRACRARADAC